MSNVDPVQEKLESVATSADVSTAPIENEAAASKEKPPKGKPIHVKDLEQLLHVVYDSPRPRTTLKNSEIVAIETGPGLGEIRRRFLERARDDLTLERTRHLMLIAGIFNAVGPRAQIRGFVQDVLKAHPAFQTVPLVTFLDEDFKSGLYDAALRSLAAQKYSALPWPSDGPPLKKSQLEKCRSNALQCFLLFSWSTGEASLSKLVEQLRTYVWRGLGARNGSELKIATTLLQSRDTAAASIVHDLMHRKTVAALADLETVRIDEKNTLVRAENAERKLSTAESLLDEQRGKVAELEQKLRSLGDDFADYRAVSTNKYENLRGRVLSSLRSELTLLDAGLHALKREPPKVDVMIDHAERAIDGIKGEISRLEEK